jgi:hypothetical protein
MPIATEREARRRDQADFGSQRRSGESFGELGECAERLTREVGAYLMIKAERVQRWSFGALVTIAGWAIAIAAALVTLGVAIVFTFAGAADGLAVATGHPWLGSLMTGIGGLLLAGAGIAVARRALAKRLLPPEREP